MENLNETWRQINYHNNYYVSNFGRIKNISTGKILSTNYTRGRGYKYIKIIKDGNKKNYYIHRLVAEAFLDNPNDYKYIDHISLDKLDNRVSNLRWCDAGQNMQNRKATSASGLKGVALTKNGKYTAKIRFNNKNYHIGTFESLEDAGRAYDRKAKEFFGLGAKTNF